MLGPVLALGSSLTGGTSDFVGGTASRRVGTLQFLFCTQLLGLVFACAWVAISGDPLPGVAELVAAVAAGLSLAIGLAAFFQAMVVGTMSIVAPIAATGVVVPIAAGIARGERPGVAQAIGILAAIAGIVLATHAPRERAAAAAPLASAESGIKLALLAALGCGLFIWLMAPASHDGVPWALLVTRVVPVFMLAAAVRIRRASLRPALGVHTVAAILACAVLNLSSIATYAYATLHGQLAIVSMLASLYPVVTVLLAYRVLGERIRRAQQLGIAVALVGVVLLSA